jgi:hypothetical protein
MTVLLTADHFTTVLLLAVVLAMVRWERQATGAYLSPIFLVSVPYSTVVAAINFIAVHFGYFTVSYKANLLVTLFFGLFFSVGLIIRLMFPPNKSASKSELSAETSGSDEFEVYYRIVAVIAIMAGLLQFRQVIGQTGIFNVGSPQFKELYGGGILGHIILLSRPAFFFLFVSTMRKWSYINALLLAMIFSIVAVPQVKYQIIIIILAAGIYAVNLGVIKVTLRKSLFAILIVYFLFNLSFVIGFSASGLDYAYSDKVQAFLFNHFFTYLFGGPIGFSEILEMKQYPYSSIIELLAVPANIYKAILGDSQYVQIIIRQWLPISTITQYFHGTNTFGLFGMLYAYTGITGAGIFTMLYAALAYMVFHLSLQKPRNLAFQMAYAYIGAFLVLSFFGLYLNMLAFYEVLVYIMILHYSMMFIKRLNEMTYRIHSEGENINTGINDDLS